MNTRPYSYIILLLVLSVFLVSCDDSFSGSYTSKTVDAVIRIEGLRTSKHIEADISVVSGAYYSISGTGPKGRTINRTINASDSSVQIFSGLVAGTWTFDVSLCTKTGTPILRGTKETTLSESSNEITVNLSEVEGKGSLFLSASITGISTVPFSMTVDCVLTDKNGLKTEKTLEIASSGTGSVTFTNLNAGYYDLSLILRDMGGCKVGGATETVRIISSLQSYGSVSIPVTGQDADDEVEETGILSMSVKNSMVETKSFAINKSGARLSPVFDSDVSSISFSSCTYQWYEDGSAITGARNASYTVNRTSGRWRYDLVISFSDGSKSSAGINLQF